MDCQKFDSVMMDALYDELDELTHAAAKRHMEGCSRCANLFAGLRATHDVGVLPLEEPSEGLEPRILAATLAAQQKTPWHRKALRGLAWAGSHAMRPQLAMAALFVLVIGSSLLLLRPMPASMPAPVRVTERGVPAPEPSEVQISAPVAAIPTVGAPPVVALTEDTAAGKKEKGAAEGAEEKPSDAKAALAEARAVRQKSGCSAAVKAYDDVGARFPATVSAADAMWEAAECYKSMGDTARARELYLSLQSFSSYRARAEQELAADQAGTSNSQASQLAARAAGGMPPAAAPAAPAQAAPPPVAVASKAAAKPTATAEESALDNENEAEAKKPAGGAAGAPKAAAPARTKAAPASADGY